jgi:hypothetical protein
MPASMRANARVALRVALDDASGLAELDDADPVVSELSDRAQGEGVAGGALPPLAAGPPESST